MPDSPDNDATHILAADHRKVEDLFEKAELMERSGELPPAEMTTID